MAAFGAGHIDRELYCTRLFIHFTIYGDHYSTYKFGIAEAPSPQSGKPPRAPKKKLWLQGCGLSLLPDSPIVASSVPFLERFLQRCGWVQITCEQTA